MITLLKGKILNRKGLNLCLLFGIVLFLSVAICTPMFEEGSYNRLIQSKFDDYITANNEWPMYIGRGESLVTEQALNPDSVLKQMDEYLAIWNSYLGVDVSALQQFIKLQDAKFVREYGDNTGSVGIYYLRDLSSHIDIVNGEGLSEGVNKDGYECLIPLSTMDDTGLITGEKVTLSGIKDESGEALTLTVKGIVDISDNTDPFFIRNPYEMHNPIFVNDKTLKEIISRYDLCVIETGNYEALDYTSILAKDTEDISFYISEFMEKDKSFVCSGEITLKEYATQKSEVATLFMVLEIPLFALVLFFIYMVTNQIIGLEAGEIAMLKSRGYTSFMIIRLYMCQALCLSLAGLVIALPVGSLMCYLAGSSIAFLKFDVNSLTRYRPVVGMAVYAALSLVIVVVIMTIPVISYSRYSIVNARNRKVATKQSSPVQRFYLDIILCVITVYLYHNYNRQIDIVAADVINGKPIDGMMFLCASLLIFAMALLSIRLIGYLISIVYAIGRKNWKPNMYASFLELCKRDRRRDFISIFIIFTVAMSIYEANLASTINSNNDARTEYNDGCDLKVMDTWIPQKRADSVNKKMVRYYVEPDFGPFRALGEDGVGFTRVIRDNNVQLRANNIAHKNIELMAINTKEFGETARLKDGLNDEHWYEYLNALAARSDGVLISSSLADASGIKVGDKMIYGRISDLDGDQDSNVVTSSGVVVGIFDAFPGYERYEYKYNTKGEIVESERHMIVTNYASEVNVFGVSPYEVWMNLNNSKLTEEEIVDKLDNSGVTIASVTSLKEDRARLRASSKVQITNGLFSLSFIISVASCAVGMMIYWISSMKNKAMLLGIYRAMGMSLSEVMGIIINEQVFASVFAWLFGGAIGLGASLYCIRLLATVYLPYKHNIPPELKFDYSDIIKLMLLVFMIIIMCIMVMRKIIKESNVVTAVTFASDLQ